MAKPDPVTQYLAEIGRRGGLARVPKGVATLSEEEQSKRGKQAAQARWGKKPAGKLKRPPKKRR